MTSLLVASSPDNEPGSVVRFGVDAESGELNRAGEHRLGHGVIALAAHPSREIVYAVGGLEGRITALGVSLQSISHLDEAKTVGAGPVSAAVSASGQYLLTANYESGDLVAQRLRADGTIGATSAVVRHSMLGAGPFPNRQESPHLHQVRFDDWSDNILVTDLGADMIYVYRLNEATGELTLAPGGRNRTYAGSGPRHLVIHPSGLVVVSDELGATVSSYRLARESGELTFLGRVPAAREHATERNYPSEVLLTSDRRRVYVANRGQGTIAGFSVATNELAPVVEVDAGRAWPEHFVQVSRRLYCACKQQDEITMLEASEDGSLTPGRAMASVRAPRWILVHPS